MAMTFNCNLNPDSTANGRSLGSSSSKWKLNGYVAELLPITVTASNDTSVTINDNKITADHIVVNQYMQLDGNDVSYTTSSGSITLTCSSGIPAMTLYLGVKAV